MSIEVTTVGPLTYATRDELREFKDSREGVSNYNEAIRALLEEVDD
jgi:hypothetical protein